MQGKPEVSSTPQQTSSCGGGLLLLQLLTIAGVQQRYLQAAATAGADDVAARRSVARRYVRALELLRVSIPGPSYYLSHLPTPFRFDLRCHLHRPHVILGAMITAPYTNAPPPPCTCLPCRYHTTKLLRCKFHDVLADNPSTTLSFCNNPPPRTHQRHRLLGRRLD